MNVKRVYARFGIPAAGRRRAPQQTPSIAECEPGASVANPPSAHSRLNNPSNGVRDGLLAYTEH